MCIRDRDYAAGDTIYVHTDRKGLIFSVEPHPSHSAPANGKSTTTKKKVTTAKPKPAVKPKTKEELAEEKRQQQLKDLKKATKDVEQSVKDIKKIEGEKKNGQTKDKDKK